MKLGRGLRGSWVAALPFVLALGVAPSAVAETTEAAGAAPAPASSDPLAPASLLSGPSLYETGKVGLAPEAAPPPTPTPGELKWAGDQEKSVQPVAAGMADAPPPKPPQGTIDPVQLDRELNANLSALDDCRIEVARTKRIAPGAVVANELLLRWTIKPSGSVGLTQVVATTPVDMDVMTCVKATMMTRWSFTRPQGGQIELERTFAFRKI
jgi:hypothetical protein